MSTHAIQKSTSAFADSSLGTGIVINNPFLLIREILYGNSKLSQVLYTVDMKNETAFASVEDYISTFPKETQVILKKVRKTIKEAAPEASQKISYNIPTFFLSGNLIHFAGFKNHIGLYPGPAAVKQFAKKLAKYKTAKGSIQFPLISPIPYDLIKEITAFCVSKAPQKR
jgi:uncharacterized protein YdhG (YjbR/CyaY superfamily)